MYKEVLQSIKGADVYGIISLIIFIASFIVITIKILRMDKSYLNKMKQLPLEPENNSQNIKGE
jgi:hypothetical protein